MEEWRDIKGYEGLYQVSNFGKVKSLPRYKVRKVRIGKIFTGKTGYKYVNLTINGITKHPYVHRLIAEAFIPNPNNLPEINHFDGIKSNNQIENLIWCTRKENVVHSLQTGLRKQNGEDNYNSKLNNKKINEIRCKYIPRVYIMKTLAEEYNVSFKSIQNIIHKKSWRYI